MADVLQQLKVLIDSFTPIVVMETVEEARATRLIRLACSSLELAAFEWTIATGLVRCGMNGSTDIESALLPAGAVAPGHEPAGLEAKALYNSREPAQMLANLEGISIEAAFILKDLHRHMEDPIVVRRLRDVGQKFAANRRTVILTAKINIPPELASLVEFLELPLPDKQRLRQILDEVLVRISRTHTLQRKLDPSGVDQLVDNLRGLTEEERSGLCRKLWCSAMRFVPK